MYSLLLDTLIEDKQEKQYLLSGYRNIEAIKLKSDWARKYVRPYNLSR